MYKLAVFVCSIVLLTVMSCKHDADVGALRAVSFSGDIQPILAGNCTMSGCHSDQAGGGNDDEAFPLVTYNDVMDHGEISPGNAHNSELYQAITNNSEELMPPPPRPMLTEDQIRLVYVWIEQGAANN